MNADSKIDKRLWVALSSFEIKFQLPIGVPPADFNCPMVFQPFKAVGRRAVRKLMFAFGMPERFNRPISRKRLRHRIRQSMIPYQVKYLQGDIQINPTKGIDAGE